MTTSAGSLGDHLTNAAGRSLYMFASDTAKKSTCTGACASAWPPLLTHGSPKAGHGASAAKLGTITRPDGTHQVTYAGHPLYTFADDTAAGQTNGQGSNGFGAKWWVLAPSGTVITSAAPSGGSSSTTSGGGGYGY
jgi:predicted lipoprotein with Yx(FWY)xxD motif